MYAAARFPSLSLCFSPHEENRERVVRSQQEKFFLSLSYYTFYFTIFAISLSLSHSLNVYLKPSSQGQHHVYHAPTFDVVILRGFLVVHLLSTENQPLLHRRDAFLLFHSLFDSNDGIGDFDVEFDLFASQGFHFDHHLVVVVLSSPPQKKILRARVCVRKCFEVFSNCDERKQKDGEEVD